MVFLTITAIQKKKLSLWLLAGSSLAAVLMLLFLPGEQQKRLSNLAQTDSLIQQELALFNISSDHVRSIDYQVTEQFTRKKYVVDLPVQVSKTHLHSELNNQLRPFGVTSIGYVNVPDNEMALHLLYRDKIIRTLELRTDPEYVRVPHPASLLIYFDRRPTASQLGRIRRLNVPVDIVLRSASHRSLVHWAETISDDFSRAGIWFNDVRTTYDEPVNNDVEQIRTLEAVAEIVDRTILLDFSDGETGVLTDMKEQLKSMDITVSDAGDIKILNSEDRFEFNRQMLAFSRLARQAGDPRILVRGTDRTLDWLERWIPRIQRGGVVFVSQ